MISRRLAIVSAAAVGGTAGIALIEGCAGSGSTGTTDAQILADAAGVVTSLETVVGQINAVDPNALGAAGATITAGLAAAADAVTDLTPATPATTGASTLSTIDGYISDALGVVAKVLPVVGVAFPPLLVAVPIVDGAIALLPTIESYVNPLLVSTAAPATASVTKRVMVPAPLKVAYTAAQARKKLGIATVK